MENNNKNNLLTKAEQLQTKMVDAIIADCLKGDQPNKESAHAKYLRMLPKESNLQAYVLICCVNNNVNYLILNKPHLITYKSKMTSIAEELKQDLDDIIPLDYMPEGF